MKLLVVAAFLTASTVTQTVAAPLAVTMSANQITSNQQVVRFDLTDPGQEAASTHIFSLQGEQVGELTAQSLGRFSWDGKNIDQEPVASGMYVVQIRHHGEVWHAPVMVNH